MNQRSTLESLANRMNAAVDQEAEEEMAGTETATECDATEDGEEVLTEIDWSTASPQALKVREKIFISQ
jgi:hypothetical protein